MACDSPLKAFRSLERGEGGKPLVTFNPLKALNPTNPMLLPCGRCTGCRLERSRQWALRCVHESQLYQENCFITLTFADEHLPANYSVDVRDWQLFMKRLRKSLGSKKFAASRVVSTATGIFGLTIMLFSSITTLTIKYSIKKQLKICLCIPLNLFLLFGRLVIVLLAPLRSRAALMSRATS